LSLVSTPSSQIVSPMAPPVNTGIASPLTQQTTRPEQRTKRLQTNRPTVNSLMHLYGSWILDACLLQTKDRYSRSSTIVNPNDRKNKTLNLDIYI
jgi:hypothetical protein